MVESKKNVRSVMGLLSLIAFGCLVPEVHALGQNRNTIQRTPSTSGKVIGQTNKSARSGSRASLNQNQSRSPNIPVSNPQGQSSQRQNQSIQRAQKLNGGQLYIKAREYFAAGRYEEAIKYAAAAQRRTKQSKLPTILVAQSYYRLGKNARAAKLFLTIPVNDIPKEAIIDYVLTMFTVGRYREVVKAYPAVPDGHPYKDVARFYTGVSLIQFKLYEKAQFFLRNARKLPGSLISQKRRLLSELDVIIDRERGLSPDQDQQFFGFQQAQPFNFYSVPSAPPPPPVVEPLLPGGVPGKAPAQAKPAPPTGPSTSYLIKFGFDFAQKSTFNDYHGYKEERSESRVPAVSALFGLKYLGTPRPFGAQPSLDLALNPGYSHTESTKSSSRLTATEVDPDTVQNVVSKSEASSYSASNNYGLTALYPVSDPVDIGLSYTVSDSYAKANTKNVSSTATANGKIAAEIDLFKIDVGYDSIAISSKDAPSSNRTNTVMKANITRNGENSTASFGFSQADSGKPEVEADGVKSTTSLQLSWLRNFEDFSLGVSVRKVDKTRLPGKSKGVVLGDTTGKLEGSYNLSFGVTVVGSAAFSQLSSLPVFKDSKLDSAEAPDEAMASGTATKYTVSLKVAPLSFVSLSAAYEYGERQLTIGEELLKKRLMQDNWSLQTSTSIAISASYSF